MSARMRTAARRPRPELPTREALRHGDYAALRVEKGGTRVAVNRGSTPLRRMERRGSLTRRQREAGEAFEALWRTQFGRPGADLLAKAMVLGVMIRGGAEGDIDRKFRSERLLDLIRDACPQAGYSVLVSVAVHDAWLGPQRSAKAAYVALRGALDVTADVLMLPA